MYPPTVCPLNQDPGKCNPNSIPVGFPVGFGTPKFQGRSFQDHRGEGRAVPPPLAQLRPRNPSRR